MHDPTVVAALFLREDGLVNFDNLFENRSWLE